MRKLLLLILLLWNIQLSHAQVKVSSEVEKFIPEVVSLLKGTGRSDYNPLINKFPKVFQGFTIDLQQVAIKQVQNMQQRKMTVAPYFGFYLNALVALGEKGAEESQFLAFHRVLDSLNSKGFKPYELFCTSAELVLKSSILYQTNAVTWKAEADRFDFAFEDGKAVIKYEKADLICNYSQDSLLLSDTRFVFSTNDQKVTGTGGKIDFRRLGYSGDSLYCQLQRYNVLLRQPELVADTAMLYLDKLGGKTLTGSFVDQVQAGNKRETFTYPRFTSFGQAILIKEIFPNVNYFGRYAIEGNKYICLAPENATAEIQIIKNNQIAIRAQSKLFTIKREDLIADAAATTIYLDKDSIYHPGLTTRFNASKRQLSLFIEKSNMNKSAFSNSYHQLDINAEAIIWNIDEPKLLFRSIVGTGESQAVFTSKDFFSMQEFREIQSIASYHPLARLKGYCSIVKDRTFGTGGFANYMKVSLDAVRSLLLSLASQGFIQYDRVNEVVLVQDKTFKYLDASGGKIDFDVIRFVSRTNSEPNAELNIEDKKLLIKGVPIALLSDSHQVYLVPRGNQLTLKKNRDIEMEGQVRAGALDFYGDGFNFNYDAFTMRFNNVDSLRFRVFTDEVDKFGRKKAIPLRTVMSNINGDLFIDDPKNKSGKKALKKYPIFDSKKDCYVYFDGPEIRDGVYTRDRFYFLVKPYILDSLDNVSVSKGLEFNGTLFSGGIIPNLPEILKVMPDYSLGFVNQSPAAGYPLYKGKATFFKTVRLDMGGLQGKGQVRYLNTKHSSDEYVFMPDSAVGMLAQFDLEKKASPAFPQATGKDGYSMWKPYMDSLYLTYRPVAPLRMYEDQTSYFGSLIYTPRGITGDGSMFYGKEELTSKYFIFAENSLEADSAILKLASSDPKLLAFKVEYMKAKIDFTAKKGIFASAIEESKVDLPFNQYVTYLREFDWDMKNRKLVLGNPSFKGTTYARFVSQNPAHDGFEFTAEYAKMDFNDYILKAEGVKEIHTGDAVVIPDSGKVEIEKEAKMKKLFNAQIFVDSTNRTHRIYKASVNVEGRRKYSAEGVYDYTNLTGKTQNVSFNNIRVDDKGITKASGIVTMDSLLEINPGFKFSGNIQLEGNRQELEFTGVVHLSKMIPELSPTPFKIRELVDPKKPFVKFSNPLDQNDKPLYVGMAYNKSSGYLYPLVFNGLTNPTDTMLFLTGGVIRWDPASGDYIIGDSLKVLENEPEGSFLRIVSKDKSIKAEGLFYMLQPKAFKKFKVSGQMDYTLATNKCVLDVVILADLNLPEEASKKMTNALLDVGFNYEDYANDRELVSTAVYNLVGTDKARKVVDDLASSTVFPTSGELKSAIVFSDIKMEWFPEYKAWQNVDKMGLAHFNGEPISKKIPGIFDIQMNNLGTVDYNLMLEIGENAYYLFTIKNESVAAISSNMEFNDAVIKRVQKPKKGDTNRIELGTTQTRDALFKRTR